MARKLGWHVALVCAAMLGVLGASGSSQETFSLDGRSTASVALASQATPTSTSQRLVPGEIRIDRKSVV